MFHMQGRLQCEVAAMWCRQCWNSAAQDGFCLIKAEKLLQHLNTEAKQAKDDRPVSRNLNEWVDVAHPVKRDQGEHAEEQQVGKSKRWATVPRLATRIGHKNQITANDDHDESYCTQLHWPNKRISAYVE
mmetsp:Transcript_47350/g.94191  ORF Transcript_47350/g.94191 Transcript_47350/m.94191 type:complete len:130 (-) Transcript_47350:323-712(-)